MVKLKVTVRVIPEDAYLAEIESATIPSTQIRGERRFYVIVREPEVWYIGTLALEIQRRYGSLYKHDLGKIKYLKDNDGDCDLDPEQNVAEALVDEGRALRDPSDQTVTIKVIQEQGRNVRQGSVIPDLSQVHYQFPERSIRPPVPTFQDVTSTLGKRKSLDDVQRPSVERKRSRLDEIEEEQPLASIEHGRTQASHAVVATSQSANSSPDTTKQQHARVPASPKWSFKGIGPPTMIQDSSQGAQTEPGNTTLKSGLNADSLNSQNSQAAPRNKAPTFTSQRLNVRKVNGLQTMSPLEAASSASKKFLKPRREIFAEPESDIDDSQMSPASHDTSKITPRLVPNGRLNNTQARSNSSPLQRASEMKSNGFISDDSSMSEDETAQSYLNGAEDPKVANVFEHVKHQNINPEPSRDTSHSSSTDESEFVDGVENADEEVQQDDSQPSANSVNPTSTKPSNVSSDNSSNNHADKTSMGMDTEDMEGTQKLPLKPSHASDDKDDESGSERSSTSSLASESNKQVMDPDSGARLNRTARASTSGSEQHVVQETSTAADVPMVGPEIGSALRSIASGLSTPVLDSPGEQLTHSLQESTYRSIDAGSAQAQVTGQDKLNTMTKAPKDANNAGRQNTAQGDRKAAKKSVKINDTAELKPVAPKPATKSTAKRPVETPSVLDDKDKNSNSDVEDSATLAVGATTSVMSKNGQAARGTSSDKQATTMSNRVLPPGMTQEQYDAFIRNWASNPPQDLTQQKKKTPSLRQTSSTELSTGKKASSPALPKSSTTNTKSGKSVADPKPSLIKNQSRSSVSTEASVAASSVMGPKSTAKVPSLVPSESFTSEKSKANSLKAPSEADSGVSVSKKPTSKAASATAGPSTELTKTKEPTPTPSTVSKPASTSSAKAKPAEPASSTSKSILPPSSAAIRYSATAAATPTPLPKFKPHANVTKPNLPVAQKPGPVTNTTTTTTNPTKPARPALVPTFSSARNLEELRAIARSANNSSAGSPVPSTNRFSFAKKDLLNNNDSDSSSESSDEDDSSTASGGPPPKSSEKSTSTPSAAKTSTSTSSALRGQLDPTIRDNSDDDSDESDDS